MILDISKKISEKVKIKISSDETLEIETFSVKESADIEEKLAEIEKPKEKLDYIINLLDGKGFDKKLSDKISGETLLEVFSLVSGTNKKK